MFSRLADVDSRVRGPADRAPLDQRRRCRAPGRVRIRRWSPPVRRSIRRADLRRKSPLVPLTLMASPLASSTARSASVTSSLLVTSSPSPPVPCPWFLKLRIGLVRALAADVTRADVERECGDELELARAELDGVAGPGLDHRRLGLLRARRVPPRSVSLSEHSRRALARNRARPRAAPRSQSVRGRRSRAGTRSVRHFARSNSSSGDRLETHHRAYGYDEGLVIWCTRQRIAAYHH